METMKDLNGKTVAVPVVPVKLDGHPALKKCAVVWEGKGRIEFTGKHAWSEASDLCNMLSRAFIEGWKQGRATTSVLADAPSQPAPAKEQAPL